MKKYFYVLFVFVLFLIPGNVYADVFPDRIVPVYPIVQDEVELSIKPGNHDIDLYTLKYDSTKLEFNKFFYGFIPDCSYQDLCFGPDGEDYVPKKYTNTNGVIEFSYDMDWSSTKMLYALFNVKKGVSDTVTLIECFSDNQYGGHSKAYVGIIDKFNKNDNESQVTDIDSIQENKENSNESSNTEKEIIKETKVDDEKIVESNDKNETFDLITLLLGIAIGIVCASIVALIVVIILKRKSKSATANNDVSNENDESKVS